MSRPLHIAWLGPAPGEDSGVPGVNCDLLDALGRLGHRIDCFFPSAGQPIPERLRDREEITFNWGTTSWSWDRWYSRTRLTAFASGMVARGLAMLRQRRQILEHHRRDPFDIVYQFQSIESLQVPLALTREVPFVIHPETHAAGELRALIAERELGLRCQPASRLVTIGAIMLGRAALQRLQIRRARLVLCISTVFRDHLVRDYGIRPENTRVIANPVRIARFTPSTRPPADPARVLVLGRVAARKGVDDVVAVAHELLARGANVHVRVVGGPSLWSDYTPLLGELPEENAEYVGPVAAAEVPAELAGADLLLQPSRYEPFALTVSEALASGVPVVGTSEVGAIERVDRSVSAEVRPADVSGMADAIVSLLARLAENPAAVRARARAEAERLFAPDVVGRDVSQALLELAAGE